MTLVHRTWRVVLTGGLLLVALAMISPALAADVGVSIIGKSFNPTQIVVAQGATVTWTITQSIGEAHTVTSKASGATKAGAVFNSQDADPDLTKLKNNGDTYQFTFKDAGTFDYMCIVHPEMTGTVVVLAPGQSPPAAAAGGGDAAAGTDRKLIGAGILLVTLVVLFGAAMVWRRMNPA
ncbi:MAG TPA: plastocyanin/azurin family copper-binding protein [Candidatus Limnocylindrales bacterium]|jgi:plastocyanin